MKTRLGAGAQFHDFSATSRVGYTLLNKNKYFETEFCRVLFVVSPL